MMMDRKGFLERADGVAFWLMVFFCLALIVYFYIIVQRVNHTLLFLFVIGLVVSRAAWSIVAWNIFAWRKPSVEEETWRKPSIVEVEKAESLAFWAMSLILLAVLTVEYVATNFFDHYVFSVLVAGFLTKCVMTFFYVHASRAS